MSARPRACARTHTVPPLIEKLRPVPTVTLRAPREFTALTSAATGPPPWRTLVAPPTLHLPTPTRRSLHLAYTGAGVPPPQVASHPSLPAARRPTDCVHFASAPPDFFSARIRSCDSRVQTSAVRSNFSAVRSNFSSARMRFSSNPPHFVCACVQSSSTSARCAADSMRFCSQLHTICSDHPRRRSIPSQVHATALRSCATPLDSRSNWTRSTADCPRSSPVWERIRAQCPAGRAVARSSSARARDLHPIASDFTPHRTTLHRRIRALQR